MFERFTYHPAAPPVKAGALIASFVLHLLLALGLWAAPPLLVSEAANSSLLSITYFDHPLSLSMPAFQDEEAAGSSQNQVVSSVPAATRITASTQKTAAKPAAAPEVSSPAATSPKVEAGQAVSKEVVPEAVESSAAQGKPEVAVVVAPVLPEPSKKSPDAADSNEVASNLGAQPSSRGSVVPVKTAQPVSVASSQVVKDTVKQSAVKMEGEYIRIGAGMNKPKVQRQPVLVYPSIARSQRVRGTVRVDVYADEKGRVVESKIASSPSKLLDKEALRAAKKMRFLPYRVDGKPSKFVITIPFTFSPN